MKKTREPRKQFFPDLNLLETELGNGWMVVEHFDLQDDRRVVDELKIYPAPLPPVAGVQMARHPGERPKDAPVPVGGITARLLRLVKVGKYAEPVIADYRRWCARHFGKDALRRLDEHIGRPSPRRRRKRPRNHRATDAFYAELARDYALLWKRVHAPTAELAVMRDVPLEQMRSHIHLARKNGFLTKTMRGKAGGELTPKASAELSRKDGAVKGESR
ncbi:MAG: hypothetical protein NTV05_08410 [Acidobacteria bacterium]|nr:hypothetical protein [Acidobacteriota bacterium]